MHNPPIALRTSHSGQADAGPVVIRASAVDSSGRVAVALLAPELGAKTPVAGAARVARPTNHVRAARTLASGQVARRAQRSAWVAVARQTPCVELKVGSVNTDFSDLNYAPSDVTVNLLWE